MAQTTIFNRCCFGLSVALVAAGTMGGIAGITALLASAAEESADPFVEKLPPEIERLHAQERADTERITVRQANQFHRRFVDHVLGDLPKGLTFRYGGTLGRPERSGPQLGLLSIGEIGSPLRWDLVSGTRQVLTLWISTQLTAQTVVEITIEKERLFVNVEDIAAGRDPDAPAPELGGCTVREALQKLNGPGPLERRNPAGKTGQDRRLGGL